MKEIASLIMETFIRLLKEFNLGLVITEQGHFIFVNRETGEQTCILKDDITKYYDNYLCENKPTLSIM